MVGIVRRFAVIALAGFFCVTSPAGAADTVSASTKDGYGRLTFATGAADQVTAQISGQVLTIAFNRKMGLTPEGIAQSLPGYLASGRMDADGKTYRFALSQTVKLHTSAAPGKFALDLAPQSFAGTPPDLPQPPAPPPKETDITKMPVLKVRSGAYHNFTRVVFDWPKSVPYNVFPGSGKLTVRFDALVNPDFSALDRQAPPWVKSAGWHIAGGSTIIDFTIDSASGFHDFRDGTHVVIDVLAPKTDADAYKPPGDTKPTVTPLLPVKGVVAAINDASKAMAATGAPAKLTPPSKPSPPPPAAAKAAPAPAPAQPETAAAQPTTPTDAATTMTQVADGHLTKDGAVLMFPGAGQQSVAVFMRGLNAWIILQDSPPLDIVRLKAQLGAFPTEVDASSGGGTTRLRIALRQPLSIAAFADGSSLKVVIARETNPTAVALGFARNQETPQRASLSTLLSGAMRLERIVDPTAGDELLVVPGRPGRAVPSERSYVEFSILPSAAGLVVMPFVDDLSVGIQAPRVTIGRPTGLSLTPPAMSASSPEALAANAGSPCFLDFAKWKAVTGGSFLATERRLRGATARLEFDAARRARLALAKFYLSNGFAAEALGVINFMQAVDPGLQSDMQLQTMKAAASYQMGRYRDAHNALAGSQFDQDRHAALWRGLASAGLEAWEDARLNLERAEPVLNTYDAETQARVNLAVAQAAIETGHLELADAAMERVSEKLPGSLGLAAKLGRAKLYAAEHRFERADAMFDEIEKSGNEGFAVEAIYYRIVTGLQNNTLKPQQAINGLERLRYRWRGDGLELKTLRKLAAIYFGEKRYREGFLTLRAAATNFPNNDAAIQATDDMRTAFIELFLHGKADTLPPVQALGLFYDFIELTPIGSEGDEMIRRMADRLVKVDLLGPAADLLNYQVTKRLDGVARAQVATRLAMVQLMDHKPEAVLDTLRTTQISTLPDDIAHQRLLMEARALADQKHFDRALDLIAVDQLPDTIAMRAEIYWKSGNWPVAGQKAEEALGERFKDDKPLSDTERECVMRAAVSYSLAGDQTSLDRLRSNFTPKMKASRDATAFAVVTERIDLQGIAFRDAAAKVASVDTLKAFMLDFSKPLKQ
ncbi:MAG: tetratricopeptide repeat protein [Rhizomicrobium sp.]|nr:tetratricopeptide repeat protein [Rhizomicrobium sp.]